ncbi:MAG: hypothetical protein OEW19_16155, partial [Acidobacteriota bacterium]|nr:hypothetical protein [Acidobacteriota bacterium]
WVGSASVAGLPAGSSAWYFYDYLIPTGAVLGVRNYYAQVWLNGIYTQSSLTGPQAFTVAFPAVVDQLYPVRGAYPGANPSAPRKIQFWALVRNQTATTLGNNARVYFWTSITGADVGSQSIVGLAGGASRWYLLNYPIPTAATPDGIRNYWAQARDTYGTSAWRGPQNFRMGFNYPFTTTTAGWTSVIGAWSISGGQWLYTPGSSNSIASVSHPEGTRYLDYQVRLWRYGCGSCPNRIMLRGTTAPLGSQNTWRANFMFQYVRDGQFSVFKTVAGVTTALQSWAFTPAIAQGSAWNDLRVVSYGDFFQFYINGTLVWQGYDASLTAAGLVGIGEYNDTSSGNSLYVDYAIGSPQTLGTDSAEGGEEAALPTDVVSADQLELNAAANANPQGNANNAPKR